MMLGGMAEKENTQHWRAPERMNCIVQASGDEQASIRLLPVRQMRREGGREGGEGKDTCKSGQVGEKSERNEKDIAGGVWCLQRFHSFSPTSIG